MGIEALEAGDNCAFFHAQRDYEAREVKRFNVLVYLIAVAVAAAVVGLVAAIPLGQPGVTAATGIGAVVTGTALKFVLSQKSEHTTELKNWIRMIDEHGCPPPNSA